MKIFFPIIRRSNLFFFKKDKSYSVYIEQYKNLKGDIVNKRNYPESRENMPICFINIELQNVRDV